VSKRDPRGFPLDDPGEERSDVIDFAPDERVVIWQRCLNQQVLEFALMYEIQWEADWRCIFRVDCAHNEVHYHHLHVSGAELRRVEVLPIRKVADVEAGYALAEELLFDAGKRAERRRRSTQ
jgi:hypothetical protein